MKSIRIVAVVVAFSAVWPAGVAPAADAPRVKVCGLRIVAKGYGQGMSGLRPLNGMEGASLAVLVHVPDGGLISFDKKASKLAQFVDDKGTNLLQPVRKAGRSRFQFGSGRPVFGPFPKISKDAKAAMMEISAGRVPAKGASKLTAKGTFVFKRATAKKTATHKNVALKPGAKIKAGPASFEVTKVGKPKWSMGGAKFAVTLKTTQDLSMIAKIRFQDAAGKEIKARLGSTTTMGMFGARTVTREYHLSKKLDRATVVVEYWQDMQTVKVPFSVTASVGL